MNNLDWQMEGNTIFKDFEFNNSKAAMNFMNEVAKLAEEYKRSPEIHFHSKKSVSIKIINEDSGEISEDDIRLANLLNQLG